MAMRLFLRAGVSLIVMAAAVGSAAAADLPARVPTEAPLAAPPVDWTGFYVGAHVGNAFARNNWVAGEGGLAGIVPLGGTGTADGAFGGVQAGFNLQRGAAVLGLEIDGSAADLDGNARCLVAEALCTTRVDAMGTVTARLGWAFDQMLVYAKAGGAWAHVTSRLARYDEAETPDGDDIRLGWTVGAGAAVALSPAWSARLGWDYVDLGTGSTTVTLGSGEPAEVAADRRIHRVTLGLDRKLDWGFGPLTTAAGALPMLPLAMHAADPSVPPWRIEVGTRVWYATGHTQKDLFDPFETARLNSRLLYGDTDSVAGETFGRLDHRSGLFVKGYFGAGGLDGGTLRDEDFPGETFYSNTASELKNGRLRYAGADIGWRILATPEGELGPYLGYRYVHERVNGFGCRQTATDAVCDPALSGLGLSETTTWRGPAVGLNARTRLGDRLRLEVDGAVLPYVARSGYDNHWFRPDIDPQIEPGHGWGGQIEAVLSYAVTPQWSVGVGGRYWYFTTTEAHTQFPGSAPDSPMTFVTERYGGFLQASYTIDPAKTPAAEPLLAVKAPRKEVGPRDWSGIHLGVHVGAAFGRTDWTPATPAGPGEGDVDGSLAGLQLGIDHQLGAWVIGLEGSVSVGDLDGNAPCASGLTCHTRADRFASLTGRLGYAVGDALLYGKAGAAWIRDRHDAVQLFDPHVHTADVTRTGWTVGTGLEYALGPRWSARIEYDYADFGSEGVSFADGPGGARTIEIEQSVHTVRLGANYRFGKAGPAESAASSAPPAPWAPLGFSAADRSVAFDWTGLRLGIHLGSGHADTDWSNPFGPQIFGDAVTSHGWLAGGQIGIDRQFGKLVLGAQADVSGARIDGTSTCLVGLEPTVGGVNCRAEIDALGTITGRAGWAFGQTLLYAKGGAAWAHDRATLNLVGVGDLDREADGVRWGWTIGAGIEHAIRRDLSVSLEYGYLALGSDTADFGLPPSGAAIDRLALTQDVHVAKLGVNWLFSTPAVLQPAR
ncbi:hypothetical protein A33M_0489 [Rhodovulum sp. PH10]|uniref:outer membrane beta-barrel protein n=1 Tax=Rhodovulum sp. PH10 TaxID=1187851 RepID=UPI00027C2995|nr:outer membrane beta-barrel protein [Rhodovulum sp. PH10]EJW10102.1 hypothetical protein A33M_0489 [Rhodovulum sp. PH10]